MVSLPLTEVSKIPYVDINNLHGRTLSTLSFYADGEWKMWIPVEGKLHPIKGLPFEGFYFATRPEKEDDAYFEFLNFVAQQACWPNVVPCLNGIRDDLFNMAASMRKFKVLFEASSSYQTESSRFVVTELEYLFALCRSLFDLLQELISKQWDNVQLIDKSIRKKALPKTFSKLLLHDNKLRTAEEISSKFVIPSELASYYERNGAFFQVLRTFRDRFVHGGSSIESVFVTEKGFAVSESTEPFSQFGVWNKEHQLENGLCSLRPAIAHIVLQTLEACEDYAHTIQKVIKYPPPMVPDMFFYMRGPFTSEFHTLHPVLNQCKWWADA